MRLFLALDIPEETRDALALAVEELRRTRAAVRWVRPEGMHITVKFLGETEETLLGRLTPLLESACAPIPPAGFSVHGLGAFPGTRRPRVVWAGVEEPVGLMVRLSERVEEAASSLGWEREKRAFTPHVTLGRVKGEMYLKALGEALEARRDLFFGRGAARELVLFRSILSPDGARYEVLLRFPFRGEPPTG